MTRILISRSLRAVAGAAVLTIAALAVPAASQAQRAGSAGAIIRAAGVSGEVDGQQALLGMSASDERDEVQVAQEVFAPVDGARALLEQSAGAGVISG